MSGFKKAVRKAAKFKCSIQGASGSGKTYTALSMITALIAITDPGKRIALIDTEKSATLYGPQFDFDADDDFGEGLKVSYNYKVLIAKMEEARKAGYGAVIIDSATHFWKEAGGFTRMIDSICDAQKARGGKPDSFAAWKQVDPLYRELMTYIRNYPAHVILCVRAKQGYDDVVENGRKKKVKVGMEPEFREGFEYEMDAQFAIDHEHMMTPLKHRLGDALDGRSFRNPGADVATTVAEWLASGAPESVATPIKITTNKSGPEVVKAVGEVLANFAVEVAASVTAAEESGPATIPEAETATVSLVDELLAKLEAAQSEEELKEVGAVINNEHKDGKITMEERNKLGGVFAKVKKSLKQKAA